jgi:hypothetical protein
MSVAHAGMKMCANARVNACASSSCTSGHESDTCDGLEGNRVPETVHHPTLGWRLDWGWCLGEKSNFDSRARCRARRVRVRVRASARTTHSPHGIDASNRALAVQRCTPRSHGLVRDSEGLTWMKPRSQMSPCKSDCGQKRARRSVESARKNCIENIGTHQFDPLTSD